MKKQENNKNDNFQLNKETAPKQCKCEPILIQ